MVGLKKVQIPWNKNKKNVYSKESREKMSNSRKEFYKNNPHPRGMLGKTNKWGHHSEEIKILIGEKSKGRRYPNRKKPPAMPQEQKIKISKALKGKRNPNKARIREKNGFWRGGISFEPYDKNWTNKFKRAIRKRDNQVCMMCGIHREKLNRAFDVHHINYNKLMSIPQNCISLCNSCHMKTNFNRKHWTGFFQDLLSERYGYIYSNQEIILEVKNGGI